MCAGVQARKRGQVVGRGKCVAGKNKVCMGNAEPKIKRKGNNKGKGVK